MRNCLTKQIPVFIDLPWMEKYDLYSLCANQHIQLNIWGVDLLSSDLRLTLRPQPLIAPGLPLQSTVIRSSQQHLQLNIPEHINLEYKNQENVHNPTTVATHPLWHNRAPLPVLLRPSLSLSLFPN